MAVFNGSNTKVYKAEGSDDCLNIEPRLHRCAPFVWRNNYGDLVDGSAFENDGLDFNILGETAPDTIPAPEGNTRPGLFRVENTDGSCSVMVPPPPRCWEERTLNPAKTQAGGPAAATGDYFILGPIVHTLKNCLYPYKLKVEPRIDVCGWSMFPSNVQSAFGFMEWTASKQDLQGDIVEPVEVYTDRCEVASSGVNTTQFWLPEIEVLPGEQLEIEFNLGFNYKEEVTSPFPSAVNSAGWVLKIQEVTYETPEQGGC